MSSLATKRVLGGLAVWAALSALTWALTAPGANLTRTPAAQAPPPLARQMAAASPRPPRSLRPPAMIARDLEPLRMGQDALREWLPVLPGSQALTSIGDALEANDVPMNLASYETSRDPVEILEFYARYFDHQGWPWQGLKENLKAVPYPALSATVPDQDLQLSVMVMERPKHDGATVILGVADMAAAYENHALATAAKTWGLPAYPGTHPFAVKATDEGAESITVSFDTLDAQAQVAKFYRDQLKDLGFQEAPGEEGLLHFASASQRWTLSVTTVGKRTSVIAQGTQTREEAP